MFERDKKAGLLNDECCLQGFKSGDINIIHFPVFNHKFPGI